jgi:hypothetical protein
MADTIKQKPKEFIQLEMNYLGLVVLHLCLFLFVYLELENATAWAPGMVQGEGLLLGMGTLVLALVIMLTARKNHHKNTIHLKSEREEDAEAVLKAYIRSSFHRYLLSTGACLVLIAGMYGMKDAFFAATYALFLVYLTMVRPDFPRILHVTGIKVKEAPKKESKARKI